MDGSLWISFVIVSAINIATPGPANLNTMRRALQLGAWRVVPLILGNAFGLALGGALCAAGVIPLLLAADHLWPLFQWIGIAYLLWLGGRLLRSSEGLQHATAATPVTGTALFVEAFTLAISNPKALLFYVAMLPQGIAATGSFSAQAAVLVASYCVLSILSLTGYASFAQVLRGKGLTQRGHDRFRRLCGALLIGFALKLLWSLR